MKTITINNIVIMALIVSGCHSTAILPADPPQRCQIIISWHPGNGGGDITPPEPSARFWTISMDTAASAAKGQGSVAIRTWKPDPDMLFNSRDEHEVVLAGTTEQATRRALYSATRSFLQECTMQGDPADPIGILTIEVLSCYDRFELRKPITSLANATGAFRALLDLINTHLPEDFRIK